MQGQDIPPPSLIVRGWLDRRLIDEPTLRALHEANLSCLEALLRGHLQALAAGVRSPVSESIAAHFVRLDTLQRSRLARCPVALFDARFSDAAFWNGLLSKRMRKPTRPTTQLAIRDSML